MARIIILGSASAVPDTEHENTHLLVEGDETCLLIDCPGSPIVRLAQAGVDPHNLTGIVLTHFHPDHVSGFAPLLMGMWLTGRKQPLQVYGLETVVRRAEQMLDLFEWQMWPNFYPVAFHVIPSTERSLVMEAADLAVFASPVEHMIPAVGLRFAFLPQQKVAAYSCDTQPSEIVVRLAENCDILIHEATGPSKGHTSPEAAGLIATKTNARSLYLIHYPPQLVQPETLLEKARTTYSGEIQVAQDFMTIDIG